MNDGGGGGEREQQACDDGGEAGRCGHRWAGCGALDARSLGGDAVVRALGGDAPLFVAADFWGDWGSKKSL